MFDFSCNFNHMINDTYTHTHAYTHLGPVKEDSYVKEHSLRGSLGQYICPSGPSHNKGQS